MKISKRIILIVFAVFVSVGRTETLFEVKDSLNNPVLNVSTDGLRVMNEGDTLMVISSDAIRANIGVTNKGLSRSFSVTTTSSVKGKGLINALEVDAASATMTSPDGRYTDFSPQNIFLGLNAGKLNQNGFSNVFVGNEAGSSGGDISFNTFVGAQSGKYTTGIANSFFGSNSGQNNVAGTYNTYLGWGSGTSNSGDRNTYMGAMSGFNSSGSDNIMVGYKAGNNIYGDNNIFIGNFIEGATHSNKLNIGDLLTGDFSTNALTVNGTLSVTGNTSVGGAFTSTGNATFSSNAFLTGTYFRINTDPGTSTAPISYVYQGGSSNSTSKRYAFTVNDALWVTSHAYIDGNLQIQGGTAIGKTQAGRLTIGTNSSANYKAVTLTFPTAFSTTPKINVTPINQSGINDIYSVTVRDITTTNCVVLICRVDSTVKTWGQNLRADWYAWE